MIHWQDGMRANYDFFFENAMLRKVNLKNMSGLVDINYYYTDKDNLFESGRARNLANEDPDLGRYRILEKAREFLIRQKRLRR
jgi:hypothetical protein